ncbi:hypothetical protein MCOR25_003184 [Pyricularia grisea]|nr:hypothetical protein MCOR25_003184 [Pyricularia grisea]
MEDRVTLPKVYISLMVSFSNGQKKKASSTNSLCTQETFNSKIGNLSHQLRKSLEAVASTDEKGRLSGLLRAQGWKTVVVLEGFRELIMKPIGKRKSAQERRKLHGASEQTRLHSTRTGLIPETRATL